MTSFRIVYDGPALERSEMDVRELAPALLAIGALLEAATQAIHGDKAKPQVNVKGSFKTGSFGIDFNVGLNLLDAIGDFFGTPTAAKLANAVTIITGIGLVAHNGRKTLIELIKWVRGRRVTRVESDGNVARIYIDDESVEVEQLVLAMYRSVAVRKALERTLSPLENPGITSFGAGDDQRVIKLVTTDEAPLFHAPETEDELLLDEVRRMAFSIVSLAFKDDNKWRLHDGNATIYATIADPDFLRRVDANEVGFLKGDVLVCSVRVRQWHAEAGARTDYVIEKVLEHRKGMRQIPLPGADDPAPAPRPPAGD